MGRPQPPRTVAAHVTAACSGVARLAIARQPDSRLTISCQTISCQTVSRLTISRQTIPCLALACATLACLTLACPAPAQAEDDPVAACLDAREGAAESIARCTSAIEIQGLADPKRASLFTHRGLARMASGDLDHAREDFDAAIRLDSHSSWAYNARAVYGMQKGDINSAIADYERAVQLKPDYAFAWANLGNARLVKGDIEGALSSLDEAIRLAPQRREIALTTRGKARLAQGNYARAVEDFSSALKANGRYANALGGRGYARFCEGDFDAAAEDFRRERMLRKDPESAVDLLIALRRGGHDTSAELAGMTQGVDADHGAPPGLSLFSGVITPQQTLEASADRDPRVAAERRCVADFQVGEWYLLQSDLEHARQHLARARESCDPSHPEYAAAGAELARLK